MTVLHLTPGDARYPDALRAAGLPAAAEPLSAIGNIDLLRRRKLALFCSRQCPGSLILDAQEWADGGGEEPVIVGGFHTPVEKECLRLFLRGGRPVVICPARGLERFRIPASYRKPRQDERLLLLSPFDGSIRRATKRLAVRRNAWVVAWADQLLFIHAASGGRTEDTFHEAVSQGKDCFTFTHAANEHLLAAGAQPADAADV